MYGVICTLIDIRFSLDLSSSLCIRFISVKGNTEDRCEGARHLSSDATPVELGPRTDLLERILWELDYTWLRVYELAISRSFVICPNTSHYSLNQPRNRSALPFQLGT